MHLIDFIIRIYHDARSPGRQINNFNSQDSNHYPFLTHIHITSIILTEIIIIFNCFG